MSNVSTTWVWDVVLTLTKILQKIPEGKINFIVSVALFLEYEAVLTRKSLLQQTSLTVRDIDTVLNMLAKHAMPTKIHYLWQPQLPDANDDMVLELAVSGQASAIVTFNQKDFLPLKNHFDIQIMTPSIYYKEFLVEK